MHVTDLFQRGARLYPDRLVLTGAGGDVTYDDARRRMNRLARALRQAGFGEGDRFAIYSPNNAPAMIGLLGALRAGLCWSNLNLRNALPTTISILSRGQCRVLLYHSTLSDQVARIRTAVPGITLALCLDADDTDNPSMDRFMADQDDSTLDYRPDEEAIGFQGSTGGTTGEPKLTLSRNRFLWLSAMVWSTEMQFDTPPVNLAVAPITHAAGIVALGHLALGGTIVMMDNATPAGILDAVEHYAVTTLFLPPTLIYMVLAEPTVSGRDYRSLRYFMSAASPIAPDSLREAVERFGPVMCQAYGQTEAGFPLTFMGPAETAEAVRDPARAHRLASCGRPTMMVEAMDFMDPDGHLLGPDEKGEIVVRGPTVMDGYLADPEATAEIQASGWHHTGDIGHRDRDGFIYISDRKRDMIISGGFNVFPFEVESVLMTHPAVQDCAVIGVPDAKWGEAVKAVVLLRPNHQVEAAILIALCKEKLGSVMAPKSVDFVDDLPRSPVGKVLKRDLRARYWDPNEDTSP